MGALQDSIGTTQPTKPLSYYDSVKVARYTCDEASGTINDSIGSANLTLANTATYEATGVSGSGIDFTNGNSNLSIASTAVVPAINEEFTVNWWQKFPSAPLCNLFSLTQSLGSASNPVMFLQLVNLNTMRMVTTILSDQFAVSGVNVADGSFHMITLSKRFHLGTLVPTWTAFIDAQKTCSLTDLGHDPQLNPAGAFVLGKHVGGTGGITGVRDTIEVWKGAEAALSDLALTELFALNGA
jgi:hypothetical protein